MVEYVDKVEGRVTAQLDALKLSEKTLVIFTGDNGTYPGLRSRIDGRDMSGDKGRPTDAGTHVPLLAQWKGHIPAGKVNQDLIDFTDIVPTLAEITGAKLPPESLSTAAASRRSCAGRKASRANGFSVTTTPAG